MNDINYQLDSLDSPVSKFIMAMFGVDEIKLSGNWLFTPQDWSCPCCKRSKPLIARLSHSGVLQGRLTEHHDHISEYADDVMSEYRKSAKAKHEPCEENGFFVTQKVTPFVQRFNRILICEDCNNVDAKAKSLLGDVCEYLSFSPNEIANFCIPSENQPHEINEQNLQDIYDDAKEVHVYRKKLCRTLIQRFAENGRFWGELPLGPSGSQYSAVANVIKAPEKFDPSLVHLVDNNNRSNIGDITQALIHKAKKKHVKPSRSRSERQEKKKKKEESKALFEERMSRVKLVYQNTGEPWSKDEEQKLIEGHHSSKSIDELAEIHERSPGGIKGRMKKLGLE